MVVQLVISVPFSMSTIFPSYCRSLTLMLYSMLGSSMSYTSYLHDKEFRYESCLYVYAGYRFLLSYHRSCILIQWAEEPKLLLLFSPKYVVNPVLTLYLNHSSIPPMQVPFDRLISLMYDEHLQQKPCIQTGCTRRKIKSSVHFEAYVISKSQSTLNTARM